MSSPWRGGRGRGGPRGRGRGGPPMGPPPPRYAGKPPLVQAKDNLITFAEEEDFDVLEDIPALAKYLRDKYHFKDTSIGIFDGFAWGISEQPHKIPYYSALLYVLSSNDYLLTPLSRIFSRDKDRDKDPKPAPSAASSSATGAHATGEAKPDPEATVDAALDEPATAPVPAPGGDVDMDASNSAPPAPPAEQVEEERKKLRANCLTWLVLQDVGRKFRAWIEHRCWQKVRVTASFFGHMTTLGLVDKASFLAMLNSFISVLEEIDGGGKRAERVTRIVAEALFRAGPTFYEENKEGVDRIVDVISNSITSRAEARAINNVFFEPSEVARGDITIEKDSLDQLLLALRSAQSKGFQKISWIPEPSKRLMRDEEVRVDLVYSVPEIAIPPEVVGETEGAGPEDTEGMIGTFNLGGKIGLTDGRVPNPADPEGWVMQAMLLDILEVLEVNRITAADKMMKIKDFCLPKTFRDRPAAGEEEPEDLSVVGEWVLPSTLISIILSAAMRLPSSARPTIYYTSVLREMCFNNGALMAPLLGQAIRNIYGQLDQGMDVEVARRAAEWFSVHLSNFAFQWMWKVWIPDLGLPMTHPKRAFMHRVIELEIRLAYQERIMDTLPDEMQDEKDAPALQMGNPDFAYTDEEHAQYQVASDLLDLLNKKASYTEAMDMLKEAAGGGDTIPYEFRRLAVHCVLQAGSRSFSHFLNATERYRAFIEGLCSTPEDRRDLLIFIKEFWRDSSQMRVMCIDKYLQYNLIKQSDVVAVIFGTFNRKPADYPGDWPTIWTDFHAWEVLSTVLSKSRGRILFNARRIRETEREDERVKAQRNVLTVEEGSVAMVVDSAENQISKELSGLLTRRDEVVGLHSQLIVSILEGFVRTLTPGVEPEEAEIPPSLLDKVVEGDYKDELVWDTVARLGYYKEFVRSYGKDIQENAEKIADSKIFDGFPVVNNPTADSQQLGKRLLITIYEQALRSQ